jgi:nitroreductase
MSVICGKKSNEVLEYLLRRSSASAKNMQFPGPSAEELERILTVAVRVPDHGKLVPWYFIVFEGEGSVQAGAKLREIFQSENPDAGEDRLQIEETRFSRSPVVVAVVSRMRKGNKPLWEQILSAGAVGMTLSLAAHASGYGAQWITEWPAFHPAFKSYLGLDARDHIAGFIHLGTPGAVPEDRPRPALSSVVTHWREGAVLNKGDALYDQEKFGFPEAGFDVSGVK